MPDRRARGFRPWRVLAWALGLLVAVPVALVLVLLGVAQTELAKTWIADYAGTLLSEGERHAEVRGIRGFLPFEIEVAEVTIADREGTWLEVHGLRLAWSPMRLLRGQVLVDDLGAERVLVQRLPVAPDLPEPEIEEPFSLPSMPQLPRSLPAFAAERLHVDELVLAEPVLGEAAIFRIEGGATTRSGSRLDATLDLRRTDEATASLALRVEGDLAAQTLRLEVEGSETGGLLAEATGQPQAGDLRLTLHGAGPLSAWEGRLEADAEGLLRADSRLRLGLTQPPRIALDGELVLAEGALPADLAPVLGERVELGLALEPTSDTTLQLRTLHLAGATFALDGSGQADLVAERLAAELTLHLPALAPFSGLAGAPLAGQAEATLHAEGPLRQPELRLTLDGDGLRYAAYGVDALKLALQASLHAPFERGFPGAGVTGEATLTGLREEGRTLLGGDGATLALAVEAPKDGPVQVSRLTLDAAGASASATASFDPATRAGRANLELDVADLARSVAAVLPPGVSAPGIAGGARLTAATTLAAGMAPITTDLRLTTRELSGLPPGAPELLGSSPSVVAKVTVTPGEAVAVSDLVLDGAALQLAGDARLGLEHQALGGSLHLRLPSLARLEPVVKQPLTGDLAMDLALGGTLARPALQLEARAQAVQMAGLDFSEISLVADAGGALDDLSGRLKLTAQERGGALGLETGWRYAGERVALDGLVLTAPESTIRGDLQVALAGPRATGRLQGEIRELAALVAFTQQPALRGRVAVDLTMTAPEDRQAARLDLQATGLGGDFGTVGAVNLTGSATDLLGTPALDARIDVRSFSQPGLSVPTAGVTLRGPLDALAVGLAVQGEQAARSFQIDAEARLAVMAAPRRVAVSSLTGSYAGQPLRLLQPVELSLDTGSYRMGPLALRYGDAQLAAQASLAGGRVEARLQLEPTPLELTANFGAPSVGGTVAVDLRVSGAAAAPSVRLTVTGRDIEPPEAPPGLPPLALDLDATVEGGRLQADARLSGATERPLTVTARLPLRLALQPFAFDLPRNEPIQARVQGEADLARIGQILALDGQRLEGRLVADLAAGGTLQAPSAQGSLVVENGLVEDAISGLLLRDLQLRIEGNDREIRIARLSANGRNGGTLSGDGRVELAGLGLATFRAGIDVNGMQVLNNQYGTAAVTGKIGADGNLEAAKVTGRLTIDRADLEIPSSGGASTPPVLDVAVAGEPAPEGGSAGPGAGTAITLDIGVEMPNQIFLRGRGLVSEWRGSLNVQGSANAPQVLGEISAIRGYLDFFDRRFIIERGVVSFDGRQPPIPRLAITASSTVQDFRAIITVEGPADEIEFRLSSEPPLPQDEILSRLLFNRSAADITPAQGLRLAAAIQELRGGGGGFFEFARRTLGVDTLDVGGTGAQDASVRVGKYLSDDVYVEVEQGAQAGTGKAKVSIELAPNISATTEVGQDSSAGVSLQWKYDY